VLVYLIHDKGTRAKPLSGRQRHRNRRKSSVRSKVEFPFRIIKRLRGHASVRYRGLKKNTARLHLLFPLSNLYPSTPKSLTTTRKIHLSPTFHRYLFSRNPAAHITRR